MKALLVAAFLCVGSQAFAALPPLYQSKGEIEAILNSPEFGKSLSSGELIEEIKRTSVDYEVIADANGQPTDETKKTATGYEIITNYHTMTVIVHYQNGGHIGPAEFTLEFQAPVSLE